MGRYGRGAEPVVRSETEEVVEGIDEEAANEKEEDEGAVETVVFEDDDTEADEEAL